MAKILNFGSMNIDYVYQVPHFVSAGETLASTDRKIFPGGKGLNQSIALARAGATVYHAARSGVEGDFLLELMAADGVDTSLIEPCDESAGHAIIQVAPDGENCILLFAGSNFAIDDGYRQRVFAHFGPDDWLLLQNEVNDIAPLIKLAAVKGMQIALNPSPCREDILSLPLEHVNWLILNEIEAATLSGEKDADKMAERILARYPHMHIVLTLGSRGVRYLDQKQAHSHGIFKVEAVDTTGAGDTFTGYFLSAVMTGREIPHALRIASAAAAIAISRPGAAPSIPQMTEVEESDLLAL